MHYFPALFFLAVTFAISIFGKNLRTPVYYDTHEDFESEANISEAGDLDVTADSVTKSPPKNGTKSTSIMTNRFRLGSSFDKKDSKEAKVDISDEKSIQSSDLSEADKKSYKNRQASYSKQPKPLSLSREGTSQVKEDGIIKKMKEMQVKAGNMQAKLHNFNVFLLKIRSLVSWTDKTRTKLFLCILILLTILLRYIGIRYIWGLAVVFIFSKPLRSKEKDIFDLLFEDFWNGLPVDSFTHTNLDMAAIYSLYKDEV
eukprot:CAMPEP_0171455544 /NCGR_PEP_ID=MMETSP0945-20130129/2393_1 /TAXON_ID=109269 /ORGANISM="Vaucheria litorea, Strain CCMP2940" /LENGTH=256 /DNA_ID=CAMNT_0011980799 /DNA_START=1003 /DNA_END=1773 /DNA_ORIENTATION=+